MNNVSKDQKQEEEVRALQALLIDLSARVGIARASSVTVTIEFEEKGVANSVYEIFEIKLIPKENDFRKKLDQATKCGWHIDGGNLVKTDGGLQYVLDLSHFNVRCFVNAHC